MKPKLIGVSQNIQRIRALIDQIADTGLNTIIYGETGVGKELIVQCLYHKSNRVGKPFVKVNCAALPEALLETELFGYEKGAFSGADAAGKIGLVEKAADGTLFLHPHRCRWHWTWAVDLTLDHGEARRRHGLRIGARQGHHGDHPDPRVTTGLRKPLMAQQPGTSPKVLLVDDEATLQIEFGHLPIAIVQSLDTKKDLGLHTQLITDGLLPLFEKNVITNKKKTLLPGRVVASLCMGTEKLYRFVDNNPAFYFRSSEFVNDPTVIARNDNLVSISSALEVDLTGQVCSDSMGQLFYSGIGDQVDFLRGSAMSKGGFSIIALPSTAQDGKVSRIVPHLSEGAGVATTRGDVNFVITEYGIAELHGKGIYQRVMELAQVAHPKFREELIEVAKKHHYIFADQLPPTTEDLLFLEGYKNTLKLKNGKIVEFRPLLPSDEFAYRNFFYSLQEKTIYMRFFYKMRTFSHEVVQKQWSSVDYHKNMSIIGRVQKGGHKEIMAIGSYAADDDNNAEVAFVVREDFQGMGIATYLIEILEKIAKENHYTSFSASVLRENAAMIRVFKKRYPNAKISVNSGSDLLIRMDFADAIERDNRE